MGAGFENFPLRPNREARQGQEKVRSKVREKRHPCSQDFLRVIIVCSEMGNPYFKVRWCTRLRAQGPWESPRLVLDLETGERERIQENGISLTLETGG